jgi:hypothetical protein
MEKIEVQLFPREIRAIIAFRRKAMRSRGVVRGGLAYRVHKARADYLQSLLGAKNEQG